MCENIGHRTDLDDSSGAPAGSFTRPDLVIPCRVAPQQSPAPFHQARNYMHCSETIQEHKLPGLTGGPIEAASPFRSPVVGNRRDGAGGRSTSARSCELSHQKVSPCCGDSREVAEHLGRAVGGGVSHFFPKVRTFSPVFYHSGVSSQLANYREWRLCHAGAIAHFHRHVNQ